MADTYTREQIVRKLKRLRKKADEMRRAPSKGTDFLYYVAQSVAFCEAIAAFPPKKRGSK